VARLTIRLTDRMSEQLEALAHERGLSRARFVRQLISEAVAGVATAVPAPPTEEELVAILAEKARQGNVAAIRTLRVREEQRDPRERTLLAPQQLASSMRAIGARTRLRCAASQSSRASSSGAPAGGPPVLVTRISSYPSSAYTRSTSVGAASRSAESWM
jgi:hypothetical protein